MTSFDIHDAGETLALFMAGACVGASFSHHPRPAPLGVCAALCIVAWLLFRATRPDDDPGRGDDDPPLPPAPRPPRQTARLQRPDGPMAGSGLPPTRPPERPPDAGQSVRPPAHRIEVVCVDRLTPAIRQLERDLEAKYRGGGIMCRRPRR